MGSSPFKASPSLLARSETISCRCRRVRAAATLLVEDAQNGRRKSDLARWALVSVALMVIAAGATSCGDDDEDPPRTLSVVTANMANAVDVDGFNWQQRIDRFAAAINRTGVVPDIVSMTESAGLWRCSLPPFRDALDYDTADRLLMNLRQSTGVKYRIAYMDGAAGNVRTPPVPRSAGTTPATPSSTALPG